MATITLTEDLLCISLVIDAGDELITDGYDVYVLGEFQCIGILDASAGVGGTTNAFLRGDATVTGTIIAGNSIFNVDGGLGQSMSFNGATFYDFVVDKSAGDLVFLSGFSGHDLTVQPGQSIKFAAGSLYQFNSMSMTGTVARVISLRSTADGLSWYLKLATSPNVSYVDVRDSDARSGLEVLADDGTNNDLGNNFNWIFGVHIVRQPSLTEILEHRYAALGAGNSMVGGNPHRFVELFGGSMVEMWAFPPDPGTFRNNFYYNTTENRLYKKLGTPPFWKMIGGVEVPEYGGIPSLGSSGA